MNINENKIWIDDINKSILSNYNLNELFSKSILITGCTGLICSAIIDILVQLNINSNKKITIFAAGRNEEKIKIRFYPFIKEKWFNIIKYDSTEENEFNFDCDYIIHGASNASPNKIIIEPVETMFSNFIGVKNLLEYSKNKNIKRLVYVSSSEVYGNKCLDKPRKPNDYNGIDILNPRSSYSIGKCAAETLCSSYFKEYGVNSSIVRPGHIYGPTMIKNDNRVSQEWCLNAAKHENIIIKSDGSQIRSYCYCLDCATAILTVLLKGESVKAYNISNPNSVKSILDIAKIISKVGNVNLIKQLPTTEEKKSFNPMSNSSLDSTELISLGWNYIFNAEEGFSHTIEILKEINR